MPHCSVIIPVWNRASFARQCLDRLLGSLERADDVEILAVDDGSTGDASVVLATYHDRVTVVRHTAHGGFAAACNSGAAAAQRSGYLIFLAPETIPADDWLQALVTYVSWQSEAAIVGSKIKLPGGVIEHCGIAIGQDSQPRPLYVGFPADHPAVNRSRRFQAVSCAGLLVRRELFEILGGFDLAYTGAFADVDLCLRAGQMGREVHYCHQAELTRLAPIRWDEDQVEEARQVYREHWSARVAPDDVNYYASDGLLNLTYPPSNGPFPMSYPIQVSVSPLLAQLSTAEPPEELEGMLQERSQQVYHLLQENIRQGAVMRDLGLRSAESDESSAGPLRELIERVLPAGAGVVVAGLYAHEGTRTVGPQVVLKPVGDERSPAARHPANGSGAIVQVEALRAHGAEYLAVPSTALWWLEHNTRLRAHLERRYSILHDERDVGRIYGLTQPEGAEAETVGRAIQRVLTSYRAPFGRSLSLLDWGSGLELTDRLPECTVFSPAEGEELLPYVDRSIDIVVVPEMEEPRITEARRVADVALVITEPSELGVALHGHKIRSLEWRCPAGARELPPTSIVVPCFNQVEHTIRCLRALRETLPESFRGEVLIVDDASSDATPKVLEHWAQLDERVRIIRNETNLGFLMSCNRAAQIAQGELLVLLNNDTIPVAGWLPPLLRLFADRPDAGAVGAKLVYPNGLLQEAGGVIFASGDGANFGRNDPDLDAPLYNFTREVDYCSGAVLATPRALFLELGGFDERYSPGYYEDADYAFTLRERGYRVYYQPESVVIHVEGGTAGTSESGGMKRYQPINRAKFVEKWRAALEHQPPVPARLDSSAWLGLAVRG